jgi:uncharacterized protein YndB with AHSA1/START domain
MTRERRLAHSGFTLTRDYPAPRERVWDAFANEDQKRGWGGDGDRIEAREWAFDFRIVTTYDMWLDGVHMSTSVASLEFEPTNEGTRFTHVEHGTRGLLDALGRYLA